MKRTPIPVMDRRSAFRLTVLFAFLLVAKHAINPYLGETLRRASDLTEDAITLVFLALLTAHLTLAQRMREKAECSLQEALERLATFTDNATDLILVVEGEKYTYASPSCEKALGFSKAEILSLGPKIMVHPDDRTSSRRRMRTKEGSWRWMDSTKVPLDEGDGAVAVIAKDVTDQVLAEQERDHQLRRLEALHSVDEAILSGNGEEVPYKVVVDQLMANLPIDAATLMLVDPDQGSFRPAVMSGFREQHLDGWKLPTADTVAGDVLKLRRTLFVPDLRTEARWVRKPWVDRESFVSYLGAPLRVGAEILGVVEVFSRTPLAHLPDWAPFFDAIAGQASVAIASARTLSDLKSAHDTLLRSYDATLQGWVRVLDMRDAETQGHTRRVTDLTLAIASRLGLTGSELEDLRMGALLHDIGKIGVPDEILLKPGPLNSHERQIMQRHPAYAFEWLGPIEFLQKAMVVPYCHHERWDGTGYPRGLAGGEIPLGARIFAIVDVYDALTSDRPYKGAVGHVEALDHIHRGAGAHFDPALVPIAVDTLDHLFRDGRTPLHDLEPIVD